MKFDYDHIFSFSSILNQKEIARYLLLNECFKLIILLYINHHWKYENPRTLISLSCEKNEINEF